jgi:Tripartite tricarboxylate transporter TctB family
VAMQRSIRDVLAGLTFVAFGLAFAVGATSYPIGSLERMGPGLFPLVLGVLLVLLGAAIAIRRPAEPDGERLTAPPWLGLALALGAIVVFGVTVRGLGLLPSIFITAFLASLGSRRNSPPVALLLAVALTVSSYLIFVVGLQLNLPLLGPWLRTS